MKLLKEKITIPELEEMAKKMYNRLVKAVVDIEQGLMVVDAEMHADEEELLLEEGSEQDNLWGINLRPHMLPDENWIEFDSMINVRPAIGNPSRGVHDPIVRKKIKEIVRRWVVL